MKEFCYLRTVINTQSYQGEYSHHCRKFRSISKMDLCLRLQKAIEVFHEIREQMQEDLIEFA